MIFVQDKENNKCFGWKPSLYYDVKETRKIQTRPCVLTCLSFFFVASSIATRDMRIKRSKCQVSRMSRHLLQRSTCQNVRFVGFLWHNCSNIPHKSRSRISVREVWRRFFRRFSVRYFAFMFNVIRGSLHFTGSVFNQWRFHQFHIYVVVLQRWRRLSKWEEKKEQKASVGMRDLNGNTFSRWFGFISRVKYVNWLP